MDVGSGRSKTALTISLPKRLPAGEFPAKLIVQTRAGLPVESGTEIPLMIQASPLWSRCRGPVAAGGVGLVVILAGLVVVSQRVWRASRPAYCQGTLRHWPAGQETLAADLDLTALRKRSITIGSGEDCDLIIVSGSLAEHHARLRAEKTNGGVRVVLEPEAEVQRGYQIVRAAAPLQDGEVFTMGAQTFQYHSDPA